MLGCALVTVVAKQFINARIGHITQRQPIDSQKVAPRGRVSQPQHLRGNHSALTVGSTSPLGS